MFKFIQIGIKVPIFFFTELGGCMLFSFKNLNPYMNLIYFLTLIVMLYSTDNPIIITVIFIMVILINMTFCKESLRNTLKSFIFIVALVVIINPIVSHRGMTILFYIGYTPITLESVVYGVISGIKLLTLLLMGSYFNKIMDYEKLAYVLAPMGNNLSLIISLSVKFIPEYLDKIKSIKDTQKTKGINLEDKSKKKVAKSMTYILNAFFFITLEQGIITIKSIKSRGYLNRDKRMKRSINLKFIDYIFLAIGFLLIILRIAFSKVAIYDIYPRLTMPVININIFLLIFAYILFLGIPIWLEKGERIYLFLKAKEVKLWMKRGNKI